MRLPVVIVGAGPTGLTAATLLAQYGVAGVLLERHRRPYPLPRAVHVDDEVLRILQQVGIAEPFAAISRPAAGLRLLNARHRVIAEFRRELGDGIHGHPPSNLFAQPDLERLLRRNLARYPDADLRPGIEVTGLEPAGSAAAGLDEPGPITVRFRDVDTGAEGSIVAAAVLGCDGAGSDVRGFVGARLEDLGFEERWLVLDVRSETQLRVWDGVEQVCDPRRAATFMRIGPQRYRWEFRLHPGETAADLTGPGRLRELIGPWLDASPGAPPVPDAALRVERCAEYTFRARLADRWRTGRVFLLGDAAHLTPPFIGQGLGSGLRDAHNLAWKLARVLAGDADDGLLDSYQVERKPHARALIRLAVLAGWAMTGGQDRAAGLRRAVFALACRVPGFTARVLDNTSPRLVAGPLVQPLPWRRRLCGRRRRPWPGRELAGTLCPQPWVLADGRPTRLDDVLGPGFAVLVIGPVDRAVRALAEAHDAAVISADAPELRHWLARAGVRAVLLRPDRIVQTSVPGRGR